MLEVNGSILGRSDGLGLGLERYGDVLEADVQFVELGVGLAVTLDFKKNLLDMSVSNSCTGRFENI